jgi:hypothetical protein
MKPWDKQEIKIAGGAKVMAQMPLIVSASRSTDVPVFYSDWFIDLMLARIFVTIATRTPTTPPPLKTGSGIVGVLMQRL